ncbi:MAG TPA: magnesium transporter [Vicinamibacteria bacterium]|nr:magnesium transporter [Vicinamibacteria bacterium]
MTPIDPDFKTRIAALIERRNWHALRREIADLHSADIAELLGHFEGDEFNILFRLVGKRKADVFSYFPVERQKELIRETEPAQLSLLVSQMQPDDRARLISVLPRETSNIILARLPPSEIKRSLVSLSYPEDTAGRYMTPDYVALDPEMTAAEALAHIRQVGRKKETLNVVYLVDKDGRLVEDVTLGNLVLADPEAKVLDIVEPGFVDLRDTTPQGKVLEAFKKYDRVALPVTDASGHMLGIITVDDVMDVAEDEMTEDMQKIGGMDALDAAYSQTGLFQMVRKRGVWLAVLFVGELFTASAMAHYEEELARALVLTLFIPLIISSGGNSGSQAASLLIRALALKDVALSDWWRVMRRELASGLALGTALGILGFARVTLWQWAGVVDYGEHSFLIASAIGLSLIGVVTFGTLVGALLPFLLQRFGVDPATSSAPFVATLVDVTGLVIYFQVAALVLRGTLL